MKIAYPISVEAARTVAERHKEVWEKAKAKRDAALADATATKTNLPDNYWQEEHRARSMYAAAMMLVDVLSENP